MFKKMLLACSDAQLREEIRYAIEYVVETRRASASIHEARHFAEAEQTVREQKGEQFDLIVADLQIAADRNSRPTPAARLGLRLVRSLRDKGEDMAAILISDVSDPSLSLEILRLPMCEFLPLRCGADISEGVELCVNKLSGMAKAASPRSSVMQIADCSRDVIATMEFHLQSRHHQSYQLFARDQSYEIPADPRPFTIAWKELQALANDSTALRDMTKDWETKLRQLGRRLFDLLMAGDCGRHFSEARALCRGSQNLRIRFNISAELYRTVFEALHDNSDYLMVGMPIARRLTNIQATRPLRFDGKNGINILCIESDVGGDDEVQGPDDEVWSEFWRDCQDSGGLCKLNNLEKERRIFEALGRRRSEARAKIGEVTICPNPGRKRSKAWSLAREVEHLLRPRVNGSSQVRYDVVHFAGHSVFLDAKQDDDDRGFLIFAGKPAATAITISTFASWLKQADTKFVYLSSCDSSAEEAARELARYEIPAVIGFRWDLDDCRAAEYAEHFYENLLFSKPCLDEAFAATREQLYNTYKKNDNIWASPILIMQPYAWHRGLDAATVLPANNITEVQIGI